jgi:UTP--glucose-1-phosphate uridylyltransferase
MKRSIRKAVFPVAGLGTRFLPATKAMPKEMLTVVDRPLVQIVVDEAREAGIEHFVFVTGRNKSLIEDHFDKREQARPASRASRNHWASATPYGAPAISLAMSLLPCSCPT